MEAAFNLSLILRLLFDYNHLLSVYEDGCVSDVMETQEYN